MFRGARILVAPLDWGLGHAARSVPVIRALLAHGAVPVIGADGGPLAFLRDEFPALEQVRISGMQVRYGAGRSQAWAMAMQLPRMLHQVRREHHLFNALLHRLQLAAVISDQRFGLRSPGIPSVLITHQLFPFSPFAQAAARRMNRMLYTRFHRCWVPDREAAPGLAGALSHGGNLPSSVRHIGPLSRFSRTAAAKTTTPYQVVAVISGPEPQRSLFQEEVVRQLTHIPGPHLVVAGRPGTLPTQQGAVRIEGHLPTPALQAALLHAKLIVSRCGYSTLMDLEALGRSALLVPTPGQPEQEYLAELHDATGRFHIQAQHRLNIAAAFEEPPQGHSAQELNGTLLEAMHDLARLIQEKKDLSP